MRKMANKYFFNSELVVPEEGTTEMLAKFDTLYAEVRQLFIEKNNHHKNVFLKRGVPGIVMRLEDKINDVMQGGKGHESVTECFLDIAVYALLGAICSHYYEETIS